MSVRLSGFAAVLARLQTNTLHKQVTENDGIALYYFIDDRIKRVMNTLKTRWTHRSPYYKLDDNGLLINEGLFNKARPVLYSLYHDILLKSRAIEMLPIDFPPQISDTDIVTTCAIITASRDEYKKQFNNENFFVIFSPTGAVQQTNTGYP